MTEYQAIALAISFGMFGIGLLSIGLGMIYRAYKSPKEQAGELAAAVKELSEKLEDQDLRHREQLDTQRRDHTQLAMSNNTLASEVKHLADNVKILTEEVKGYREEQFRKGRSR